MALQVISLLSAVESVVSSVPTSTILQEVDCVVSQILNTLCPTTSTSEPSWKQTSTASGASTPTSTPPLPPNTQAGPSQPAPSTLSNSSPTTSLFTSTPWNPQNSSAMPYTIPTSFSMSTAVEVYVKTRNPDDSTPTNGNGAGFPEHPSFSFISASPLGTASDVTGAANDTSLSSDPSRLPGPTPTSQLPLGPHRLRKDIIFGITFGAFAFLLCVILTLLFVRRRVQKKARRASTDSARWRLRPHSYDSDDTSSGALSSVWTWTGSLSADSHFDSRRDLSTHSLDFKFGGPEKFEGTNETEKVYGRSPSPCSSPNPDPHWAETQPLTRNMSLMPQPRPHPHQDIPRVVIPASPAADPSSSSFTLLTLTGRDYPGARLLAHGDGGLGRSVSGVSRSTAFSGDVQSVEAL